MPKFKVGDRVKFDYDGTADTGTVESCERDPLFLLIYMDNKIGHSRDNKCWWVPPEDLVSLKTKRFL